MAKKKIVGDMNTVERTAGTVFFIVYLLVLPLLAEKLFSIGALLLGTSVSESTENIIYYYTLFAVTVLLFHSFLGKTWKKFMDRLGTCCGTVVTGMLLFYGANELLYRVSHVLWGGQTNLNDVVIAAQVNSAPRVTALIVLFLAPFVEEVLFRGLVFGCLREHSRMVAYIVSCALFAFMHVWTFVLSSWDLSYFVLMLQYLVPGLVFAWCFEHSGSLWTSIAVHAAVNSLAFWTIIR